MEETKRRKLALKASKIVELMMNSGIGTTSGYEERVTFNEIEVVDRNADEAGLLMNVPEGNSINGWDINICAVRKTSVKRHVRYHTHAEYLLRSKRAGQEDVIVARKYSDFLELHSTVCHVNLYMSNFLTGLASRRASWKGTPHYSSQGQGFGRGRSRNHRPGRQRSGNLVIVVLLELFIIWKFKFNWCNARSFQQ